MCHTWDWKIKSVIYVTVYKLTKTVNFIVELLDNLALVMVYPFAINNIKVRNVTSLPPINSVPNVVLGPNCILKVTLFISFMSRYILF